MLGCEYITLGPVPCEEQCEQLGPNYDSNKAREECRRYIEQLTKMFPDQMLYVSLRIKAFSHDYGTYHDVVVYFTPDSKESVEAAFHIERNLPANWID